MAKAITKKRKRRSFFGAAKKVARKTVVKTKMLYRRAKSINVTKKDIALSVAGAGAGAIGSAVLLEKIPADIQSKIPGGKTTINAAITALGGYLAYLGVKKRNMAITGLGMGMSAVGAKNLIRAFVPSVSATGVGAPYIRAIPNMGAPWVRTLSGTRRVAKMAGCARSIPDQDYV